MSTVVELPGYRVVAEPVEAGPCLVVRARRESDDVEVTVLLVVEPLDPAAVRRFRVEAVKMASALDELRSPLIVPLTDHGQDRYGRPYLVTDSAGTTLADEIVQRGPLPPDEVRHIVLGTAPGLISLHQQGILHLGLGPAALVRQPSGRVLLNTPLLPVLAEIAYAGTEGSGSEPLEVLNGGDWTPRAELYAFASTVWTLLVGRPPVAGRRYERLLRLLNEASPAPSAAGMPTSLTALLLEALARDPAARPESFASFADRLQEELARAGDPDRTAPATRPGALTRSEQVMGSDYELFDLLGSGSAGQVRRARRISDGHVVAVKVLNPDSETDALSRERLLREHRTLSGLTHPHLVKVIDVVIDRGRAAIVMEFIEGANLRELLDDGKVERAEGIRLLAEVASGLAHLHSQHVVHRDVKPANILVRTTRERRTALLTDFGLAKRLNESDLTRMGQVLGTPAYLAPETVDSAKATFESDVYALGITVYEVLAGRRLFTGSTDEVLNSQRFDEPARPPEVSDDAWRFLSACLAKDPRERPTATEASEVLHDLVREMALAPSVLSTSRADPDPSPRGPFSQFGPTADESSVVTRTSARRPLPAPLPPAPRRDPRRLLIALVTTVVLGVGIGVSIALFPEGGESPLSPISSSTTSSSPPPSLLYRVPVTLVTDPDGGATVSWSEETTRLPGLDRFVIMQGNAHRGESPADSTSYRDSEPRSSGCYFVIALGVTADPIEPTPKSACP